MNYKNKLFILASGSPRRHELLSMVGINHKVVTSAADEGSVKYIPGEIENYVISLAELKNKAVHGHPDVPHDSYIISADTVVYLPTGDRILGKPKDKADAQKTIRALSGGEHKVLTGVCIYDVKSGKMVRFAETTTVYFRSLTDYEIEDYINTESPYDKAGSYGIQEGAAAFVSRIDGDYSNVVGLPVCKLCETLLNFENNI